MRFLQQVITAFALVLAFAASAFAADLTDAQKTALTDRVSSFQSAMSSGDVDGITSVTPPKILQKIATDSNIPIDQLKVAIAEKVKQTMAQTKFTQFNMDMGAATYAALPDGSAYAEIPTDMQFEIEGQGKYKAHAATLAFMDDGAWYLLRVDDPNQIKILKEVYPGFADVEFPAGTLEQQ